MSFKRDSRELNYFDYYSVLDYSKINNILASWPKHVHDYASFSFHHLETKFALFYGMNRRLYGQKQSAFRFP